VVILNISDLCADSAAKINSVKDRSIGVDVWSISNLEIDSLQPLQKYFTNHKTVVLLGSSGVGKSTLVNNLAGEEILKTNELRSDVEKGRHTTTTRQMIYLKNGGWVIDTPGMRELGLWDAQAGISQTFTDITDLVKQCKFSNCTHTNEPGCAVQTAIREGRLEIARFKNFDKMQKEQQYIEARQTQSAAKIERDKWKSIHKQIKLLKY
jgi:ribosome biogenesis GTPase